MKNPFLYLLSPLLFLACSEARQSNEHEAETTSEFQVIDSREEEQALYKKLGVTEITEHLRIFPDTALTDTAFLIHYHKINAEGQKVRSAEYRIDGQITTSTVNEYNEAGKRIAYTSMGPQGGLKNRSEVTYNEQAYPDLVQSFDPTGELVMSIDFEYLPSENQVVQHIKNALNEEVSTLKFKVGEHQRFEKCIVNRQGKEYIQFFTYNEKGKLIEDLLMQGEQIMARTRYEYSKNGLRKFKWLIGVGDKLEGIVEYRYTFSEGQ
jgi:hypothetical protein